MLSQEEILSTIKAIVKEELPDARVYLFGSRATGKVHEESDWDILVLTSKKVNREMKDCVREKLFFLPVADFFFVDVKIVNEKDWFESPSYYVLRHSIKDEVVEI